MAEERLTRRDALKKAAYMTPVILTFLAAPAFASGGSGRDDRSEAAGSDEIFGGNGKRGRRLWNKTKMKTVNGGGETTHPNKSGGGDSTNPGGHGNEGGYNNPGNSKK